MGQSRLGKRSIELLDLNRRRSVEYISPAVTEEREAFRDAYATEYGGTVCMDGRVSVQQYTETPLGIFQPFRNIGGRFDLAWPIFQNAVEGWHGYAKRRHRPCLFFTTYHFSRGEKKRGCAGFGFDTAAAKQMARTLRDEFMYVFGQSAHFYTIKIGLETDLEALILHGNNGEDLDVADLDEESARSLMGVLRKLYPDMSEQMVNDFVPLIQGNIRHVRKIRELNRKPVDVEHRESVLAFGRGFEWFREVNRALIVGPFDPKASDALVTAGKVLLGNIREGRTPVNGSGGIVLLTSVPYFDPAGSKPRLAELKARYLAKYAYDALATAPDLADLMQHIEPLTTTVDQNTRLMTVIEEK